MHRLTYSCANEILVLSTEPLPLADVPAAGVQKFKPDTMPSKPRASAVYAKMLAIGLSPAVVRQKMQVDGVSPGHMDAFFGERTEVSRSVTESSRLSVASAATVSSASASASASVPAAAATKEDPSKYVPPKSLSALMAVPKGTLTYAPGEPCLLHVFWEAPSHAAALKLLGGLQRVRVVLVRSECVLLIAACD